MGLELKEREAKPEMPKTKTIIIDGEEVGEAKPTIYGDRLSWHVSLKIRQVNGSSSLSFLLQSHGPSPRAGIAQLIINARRERDEFIKQLESLESRLGTTGKSASEIEKWIPII